MLTKIVDVSAAQGRIIWSLFGPAIDGAIIKATEGSGPYLDPEFVANFDGARIHGKLLGTYHFAHPDESDGDAVREASHYVTRVLAQAAAVGHTAPLLFALDVEEARTIRKGPTFVRWCRTFVETVERMTGRVCWVYTGGPFWNDADGDIGGEDADFFAARLLWIAAYVDDPRRFVAMTPWRMTGHTLHQRSGNVGPNGAPGVRYPGVTGNVVDTNVFDGTIEHLRALIARPSPLLPAPSSSPPTQPQTPTSRSSQRLPAVREPIADLSLTSPATPLRAGPGEKTYDPDK